MMRNHYPHVARTIGALLGLGLALAIVLIARPSASGAGLTATARFSIPPSGELARTPPAPQPILVADSLRPGEGRTTGSFLLHNQTPRAMMLSFVARPSGTALDGLLQVHLSAAGQTLASGALQGLLHGSAGSLRLPSGATRRLELATWMPPDVGDGYEGRLIHVSLIPSNTRGRG
jgi:hypothetical protein